ncbi:MAG: hypothetical protein KY475_07995 [Planctomycetes bacterium]|nr:hypothetical protein [Planctomycetota bacterium]
MTKKTTPAAKSAKAKATGKAATKKAADSKPAQAEKKPARATVLGYSPYGLSKWMGAKGWTKDAAIKAINALKEGGDVKESTITTGLCDGKNPKYSSGMAQPTAAEVKQLKAAAK